MSLAGTLTGTSVLSGFVSAGDLHTCTQYRGDHGLSSYGLRSYGSSSYGSSRYGSNSYGLSSYGSSSYGLSNYGSNKNEVAGVI